MSRTVIYILSTSVIACVLTFGVSKAFWDKADAAAAKAIQTTPEVAVPTEKNVRNAFEHQSGEPTTVFEFCFKGVQFVAGGRGGVVQVFQPNGKPMECAK